MIGLTGNFLVILGGGGGPGLRVGFFEGGVGNLLIFIFFLFCRITC